MGILFEVLKCFFITDSLIVVSSVLVMTEMILQAAIDVDIHILSWIRIQCSHKITMWESHFFCSGMCAHVGHNECVLGQMASMKGMFICDKCLSDVLFLSDLRD